MKECISVAEPSVGDRPAEDRYAGAGGWTVEFEADRPAATLRISGDAPWRSDVDGASEVSIAMAPARRTLVRAQRDVATLYAGPAYLPVYARIRAGKVSLSNVAANLVDAGETLRIRTFVLIQHLLGANYPMDGLFTDITLLEASSIYQADCSGLRRVSSALRHVPDATVDEALDDLHRDLGEMFSHDRPVAVLLSGGYDSRLNLALARKYQKVHGFPISLWHEFKDTRELAIAQAVADNVGLPLHVKDRAAFASQAQRLASRDAYVRFHAGTYRDNLPRWHQYLDFIRQSEPGCLIVGLGAEAHKGKYYDQVGATAELRNAFGADRLKIRFIAKRMKLPLDDGVEDDFFTELIAHSEAFPHLASRIDFVHYQTYVFNGYGRRCHDLAQFFSLRFPFLGESFLSRVFSLPPEAKKDFRIVKDLLAQLAPDLMDIPFTSGNQRSLGGKQAGFVSRMPLVRQAARSLRMQLAPSARKGSSSAMVDIQALTGDGAPPPSQLVSMLAAILSGAADVPYVRLDYVAQMLRYLHLLEREKHVSLLCH